MGPFPWRVLGMVLNQLGNAAQEHSARHVLLSVEGTAPLRPGWARAGAEGGVSCAWTQALLFLDRNLSHSAAQCMVGGHRCCGPWLLCSETQGFFCLEQVACACAIWS